MRQRDIAEPDDVDAGRLDDQLPCPLESTTTPRYPTKGKGSPPRSYSPNNELVEVLPPDSMAAIKLSRSGPGKANSMIGNSSSTRRVKQVLFRPADPWVQLVVADSSNG